MTDIQPVWHADWAAPTTLRLPPWAGGTVPDEPQFGDTDFVPSEPYHDRPRDGRLARLLAPLVLLLAVAAVAGLLCWGG